MFIVILFKMNRSSILRSNRVVVLEHGRQWCRARAVMYNGISTSNDSKTVKQLILPSHIDGFGYQLTGVYSQKRKMYEFRCGRCRRRGGMKLSIVIVRKLYANTYAIVEPVYPHQRVHCCEPVNVSSMI